MGMVRAGGRRTLELVAGGMLAVTVLLGLCPPACGELDEERTRPQRKMSRAQCIAAALQNNLDIRISRIRPLRADADVTKAWGAYDPHLLGSISVEEEKIPRGFVEVPGVGLIAPDSTENLVRAKVGVQGQIPTGTSYDIFYRSRRRSRETEPLLDDDDNVPAEYRGRMRLELTQSLVRGFGLDVNLTQIRVAAANKQISEYEFRRVVMETVAAVQSAFWELVFARENLEVKKKSLAVAQDLLDRNRRRFAVGDAARFEVDQAEAGVAMRETEIIAARAAIRDAEDELKRVMNMDDGDQYWSAEIVPTDRAEVVERAVDLDREIQLAYERRPEIRQAKKNIEVAEMNEKFARNQVLPRVDVFGSYGFNSRELTYEKEIEYLVRGDDYTYAYGLMGSVPIGNRVAKGERIAAEHALREAKLQLEIVKHNIGVEVRRAVRSVVTNLKLVDANRATRELREKTLRDERTRHEVGVSTSYQVLLVEEDLAEARSSELRAVVDYRKALVALDLADGTILTKNNIELVSERP